MSPVFGADGARRDDLGVLAEKASRLPCDYTEDTIREVCLPLGLVDVKVCAVSEVWSGLKLMIRKADR